MKLTVSAIRNVEPQAKTVKMFDGKGLYLEVMPRGAKRWRFKYRFQGREKLLSFGIFPEVSVKSARMRLVEVKTQIADGRDPSELRKIDKIIRENAFCFESVALEWWEGTKLTWTEGHAKRIWRRLEKNVLPWIGKRDIREIKPADLLVQLKRIEKRGAYETAHRVRSICGQVFRYAVAIGRTERDITQDLRGALFSPKKRHYASVTHPDKVAILLKSLEDYEGHYIVKVALQIAPFVFVRPGELRHAEWSEFDFKKNRWTIPAEKMKARKPHIVPLANQVLELIEDLRPLTGAKQYLFPSMRSDERPISDNTLTATLRCLGYTKDDMTVHGFRSMASTLLNEQGYKWDVIERQLAHSENNTVRAAYNYAQYLDERQVMMQEWADYLESLKKEHFG